MPNQPVRWAAFISIFLATASLIIPFVAFVAFYSPVREDTNRVAFAQIPWAVQVVALLSVPFAGIAMLRSKGKQSSAWVAILFALMVSVAAWPWTHIVGVILRWRQ